MKQTYLVCWMALLILLFVACTSNQVNNDTPAGSESNIGNGESNTEDSGSNPEENEEVEEVDAFDPAEQDPITLTMMYIGSEEDFAKRFKEPVEEHLPYITLEQLQTGYGDLEEHFAAGIEPDILWESEYVFTMNFNYYDMAIDLEEMMDRFNFDLDRLRPDLIEQSRAFGGGNIQFLPIDNRLFSLHYNKSIFDEFGEPFPENGMTWDDVIDLAARLTGERNGVHYRGLDLGWPHPAGRQIPGMQFADPDTGDAFIEDNDGLREWYEMIERGWSIPGNLHEHAEGGVGALVNNFGDRFIVEQDSAMLPFRNTVTYYPGWAEETGLDYGIVSHPIYSEDTPYSFAADGYLVGISSFTDKQEDAFRVIEYFLSDEYQVEHVSRQGLGTALDDPAIEEQFAVNLQDAQDRDLDFSSMFMYEGAPSPERVHVVEDAMGRVLFESMWDMADQVYEGSFEINSFLRDVQAHGDDVAADERQSFGIE